MLTLTLPLTLTLTLTLALLSQVRNANPNPTPKPNPNSNPPPNPNPPPNQVSIDRAAEPGLRMLTAAATLGWGPLPASSLPAAADGGSLPPLVFGPVGGGEWNPSLPLTPNPNLPQA